MAFILVPPNQKKVDVRLTEYSGESDPGPYPVPGNAPIEGWPVSGEPLDQIQRHGTGDRHMVVVDPLNGKLFEFYSARKTDSGWSAMQASIFDLTSNRLRPDTWTSTDAAGLPIFPSIVRYDEVETGMVEHAMRFTIRNSRKAYVYPATHHASSKTDRDLPRMGERFRLRSDFDLSGFSKHPKAILEGLKKYGMFVADNGGDWRLSVAPDARIEGLDELRRVKGMDFEVVQATQPRGNTAHQHTVGLIRYLSAGRTKQGLTARQGLAPLAATRAPLENRRAHPALKSRSRSWSCNQSTSCQAPFLKPIP